MLERPFGTDPSAPTEDPESPGSDKPSAGSDGIDWESDENPYKARVSGLDTRNQELSDELGVARDLAGKIDSVVSTVTSLSARVSATEDLAAEGIDATTAETRRQQERDGLLDANETPAEPSRASRVRQARAVEVRKERMSGYEVDLNALFRDGTATDSRVMAAVGQWRAIVAAEGNRDIEIPEVLTAMRTVATEFDKKAAEESSSADDDNDARGDGDEDDGDSKGDDDDSDADGDDDAGDGDDEPSALERNAKRPESRTGGNGSAVGLDPDNMSALDKIQAHADGKKPAGQ